MRALVLILTLALKPVTTLPLLQNALMLPPSLSSFIVPCHSIHQAISCRVCSQLRAASASSDPDCGSDPASESDGVDSTLNCGIQSDIDKRFENDTIKFTSKDAFEVWSSRRRISRFVLRPVATAAAKKRWAAKAVAAVGLDGTQSGPLEEGKANEKSRANMNADTASGQMHGQQSSISSSSSSSRSLGSGPMAAAFVLAGGALVLRLGGRGVLVSLLGLDFVADSGLGSRVEGFIRDFRDLGPVAGLASFFAAWLVAKLLCLDALTVGLALSAGVLFGGLAQGTAASVGCSSMASLLVFLCARSFFGEGAQEQIARRPVLRAIDKACTRDGLKTVFTLRLSPLLPIPVAAYNYVYALTSVTTADFLLGTSAGSVKPYLLDCYLGLFGQSVLEDPNGADGVGDWALLGLVGLVVLVGTFAAQIASSTWEELQAEIALINQQLGREAEGEGERKRDGQRKGHYGEREMNVWEMFGVQDSDLPPWCVAWRRGLDGAWQRVDAVIHDEWRLLIAEAEQGSSGGRGEVTADAEGSQASGVSGVKSAGGATLRNVQHILAAASASASASSSPSTSTSGNVSTGSGAISSSVCGTDSDNGQQEGQASKGLVAAAVGNDSAISTDPADYGGRSINDFEVRMPTPETYRDFTLESIVFSFALAAAVARYSSSS